MLRAAFSSRSNSHPHSGHECHRTVRSLGTSEPQSLQACVVLRGDTLTTVQPASSALLAHSRVKVPQAASRILLFRPPFAAAPFGKNFFVSSSCLGLGVALMFLISRSSNTRVP